MHLFGSFKARSDFFCNRNRIFGARIATHPSRILAQREYSEATQLNPVASSKPISNGVKDGIHDYFEILSRQISCSQLLPVRLDHATSSSLCVSLQKVSEH